MANLKLSAPWIIFYREIEAMFKNDAGVRVVFDEDNLVLKLYVDDSKKAYALDKLLPGSKKFGRTVLSINVVPANGNMCEVEAENLFEAAFNGNDALSFIKSVSGIMVNPLTYVVFKKVVVQYWTDNIGDYFGMRSTLFQDIASDIFEGVDGVFFCTDTAIVDFYDERLGVPFFVDYNDGSLSAPLGEWP